MTNRGRQKSARQLSFLDNLPTARNPFGIVLYAGEIHCFF